MAKTELERKIEELEGKIEAIRLAIKHIRKTGISDSVLYTIIQKNSQRFLPNHIMKPITQGHVKAIISGIENLKEYMFPSETPPL